ncbi:iron hydrogenase [Lipomyces arxii]|uniref:iron hydrogenase n=1 Tax=Lipomyces arxii TaxID=56418 RepID=UPI0034CF80F1
MSAILSAQDLNDFIGPGLACINPVVVNRSETQGPTEIQINQNGVPVEVSVSLDDGSAQSSTQLTPAQINLSDCLACSGCITSAESVLVSLQSHTELLSVLRRAHDQDGGSRVFVASVSHQSRASLAAAFNVPVDVVDAKLVTLFRDILGFKYLVGTGVGRQISLAYSASEVLKAAGTKKPTLASVCPGWICYVEKTHPHVLPYLSAVKSPQQITGSLLKRLINRETGANKDEIYHVSIMPCFDKKLEASRSDFANCEGVRDVDCVITTKEVIQLLLDENIDFSTMAPAQDLASSLKAMTPSQFPAQQSWESSAGSSSGGYVYHVLNEMADSIKQSQGVETTLKVIPGKNADMVEYQLVSADEQVFGKAAQVYGFRNIQNLVRKLKPGKSKPVVVSRRKAAATSAAAMAPTEYDYVEVMACPGGCINGGGQIGAPVTDSDGVGLRQWKDMVEQAYTSMASSAVDSLGTRQWVGQVWGSDVEKLVMTKYHAVEAMDQSAIPAVLVGDKW